MPQKKKTAVKKKAKAPKKLKSITALASWKSLKKNSQKVKALFWTITAECRPVGHFIDRFVHGVRTRRRKRLGHIPDS